MTLSRNPYFDENKMWDEMLADLNLTASGMKTHKIQSSDQNKALDSMLQEPHLPIKTLLHAASPSLLPTLTPSWREIQKRLDVEANDYCYHFADEIAQRSLLEQQRKLVLASAKRINDDQKRSEEVRIMLQAPSACDCDAFSSQFAEIERVKLLVENTPKTQGTWDAVIDLSFAERKEEENEEVQETVSEIDWMEFQDLAKGEAATWIAVFLCAGESYKPFDVQQLMKVKKNVEYSPSFDGKTFSVAKSREPDCVVTPAVVSSKFNCCVKSAAASVSAMD